MGKWWENHDNKIELAGWLIDEGCLVTSQDALRYFEKPWKWEPEWEDMRHSDTGERDDRTMNVDYTCEKCDGYGWVDTDAAVQNACSYTITCPDCGGSGMDMPTEEELGLDDPEGWAIRPPDRVLEVEGIDLPSYSELADDIHFWERTP